MNKQNDIELIKNIEKAINKKIYIADKFEDFFKDLDYFADNKLIISPFRIILNEEGYVTHLSIRNFRKEIYHNKFDLNEICQFSKLEYLKITNCEIENLSAIKNLREITHLELYETQISDISALAELTKIKTLYLNFNNIENISSLKNLDSLCELSLQNNSIEDISPIKNHFPKKNFICDLDNNPLKYPPIEIVELGREAINEYFEHCEKGTSILQEAKLIVIGEAGAGKTTFAKKILNPNNEMPKPEETTLGIDVFYWNFDTDLKNELNMYEILDSRFSTSLSDDDLKNYYNILKSNGVTGIEFTDMDIIT